MDNEIILLWASISIYVLSGTIAIISVVMGKYPERTILTLFILALLLHGTSILMRWLRLEHGPYLSMFEILNSNIWSLGFVYCIVYWRIKSLRPTAAIVMPLLFIMMGWVVLVSPAEATLPPTYDTTWLVIHIMFGKIFLGSALVAVGIAVVILMREKGLGIKRFARMPDNQSLDVLAYKFMILALIFDSLMLVAGAVWAQDAWGRYWAWDPLETWAFLTWLALGIALHLRVTFKPSPKRGAWMILICFVMGFLTFFGVPFVTTSPHKGAI
jgi:ABC-type transport system involved in cytochrome c biogenesis permease subunit